MWSDTNELDDISGGGDKMKNHGELVEFIEKTIGLEDYEIVRVKGNWKADFDFYVYFVHLGKLKKVNLGTKYYKYLNPDEITKQFAEFKEELKQQESLSTQESFEEIA